MAKKKTEKLTSDGVQYIGEEAQVRIRLGPEWAVHPSRELRDKLGALLGSQNVRMLYAPNREIM